MININNLTKDFYKPHEIAKVLNITTKTIQTYCNEGKLKAIISETNRRQITRESVIALFRARGILQETDDRQDIIYVRVSTHRQKERGDLDRQKDMLLKYAALQNPKNLKVFEDVGSGLNDNRKELLKVINLVLEGKVDRIFVSYKDRLTRFGFNYLETICKKNNTTIVVVSSEIQDKSMEEELAEDIISIIHSFSGKLYGMRKKVKEATLKSLED